MTYTTTYVPSRAVPPAIAPYADPLNFCSPRIAEVQSIAMPQPASLAELFDAQRNAFPGGGTAVAVQQALRILGRTEQIGGLHPAGELIGCDQRDGFRPAPTNQDRLAGVRHLVHERRQVGTRVAVGGFVDHREFFQYSKTVQVAGVFVNLSKFGPAILNLGQLGRMSEGWHGIW